MKKFIMGVIFGCVLATTASVYADEGLQKVEAYLRPTLPITLNGKAVTLESSPVMYDGSTYLKLRDVAGLTGLQVNWNDATQTVELGAVAPAKGVTTMATTSTTPTETTYSSLRAITVNGETYFSSGDYERKFIKDGKKNGKLVWEFKNGDYTKLYIYDDTEHVKAVIDVKNEADITIYKGESYLNVKYYPQQ